jgi:hypothetical protein
VIGTPTGRKPLVRNADVARRESIYSASGCESSSRAARKTRGLPIIGIAAAARACSLRSEQRSGVTSLAGRWSALEGQLKLYGHNFAVLQDDRQTRTCGLPSRRGERAGRSSAKDQGTTRIPLRDGVSSYPCSSDDWQRQAPCARIDVRATDSAIHIRVEPRLCRPGPHVEPKPSSSDPPLYETRKLAALANRYRSHESVLP